MRCQNRRMTSAPTLRPAAPRDLDAIVALITELAEFEQLTHLLEVTADTLAPHLFGERPVAECVVAEVGAEVVAFALFFTNFSTFLARPGLYLEDLYVRPAHRRLPGRDSHPWEWRSKPRLRLPFRGSACSQRHDAPWCFILFERGLQAG